MVTTAEKIRQAFELARQLTEDLWMGAIDPQYLSVDELRDIVAQRTRVEIHIRTVDVEVEALYGFIERYDEGRKACIYIVKNINPRWKRLVGVKEICHVLVDLPEDWNPDGVDTLQRLTTFVADFEAEENWALRSEHIAEMAAIELLYPHENRRADLKAIEEGKLDIAALAARYRMPEIVLQTVLNPAYLNMCDKYWKLVHDAHQAAVFAKAANAG